MGNPHSGHRKRLREQMLKNGFDHYPPHAVLEALLFSAIPQGDTNPLAHRLIERFGSFSNVLEASPEELLEVSGVGEVTMFVIKSYLYCARYYEMEKGQQIKQLTTTQEMVDYLRPFFIGRTEECVAMVCLNDQRAVVYSGVVAEGSINAVPIYVRNIASQALMSKATGVILAHNHPNGLPLPSSEDIKATAAVRDALQTIGIPLMDHFIFSESGYTCSSKSLAIQRVFQNGML